MTNHRDAVVQPSSLRTLSPSSKFIGGFIVLLLGLCVVAAVIFFSTYDNGKNTLQTTPPANSQYPVGVADAAQPSGYAPPGPNALANYALTYETNFDGSTLPKGWNVFFGVPGGDPGGQFGRKHVVVTNGMLELNTWKDPQYKNQWVTGGLCQCGVPKTYGAYFVRSRVTGTGPNEVELLWPYDNKWPPEIDFNESAGLISSSSSTIHWSPINQIEQRHVNIDMEAWHTWGVIWTRDTVSYIVDGQVWGRITSKNEITKQPMTLDFEQIAFCSLDRECPTHPVSMQIDWVSEYTYK
jgi:hypothetical protein